MVHSVQLLGISNAIVDVLAHIDDDFLDRAIKPAGFSDLLPDQFATDSMVFDLSAV